jgi:hypothetical protein
MNIGLMPKKMLKEQPSEPKVSRSKRGERHEMMKFDVP